MLRRLAAGGLSTLAMAVVVLLALAAPRAEAITPFQSDVATAINNGLAYLDTQGVYNAPACVATCTNGAGNAVGLTTLALLEKRASGNPLDPPQGYNGASAADKARLSKSVAAILSDQYVYYLFNGFPNDFYAYFDGSALSSLSEYILSGGPDTCGPAPNVRTPCSAFPSTPVELQGYQMSLLQAINGLVDATLKNQRNIANGWVTGTPAWDQGYWCYTDGSCRDSSTTQYAALGLSAAQAVYNNPSFGDPGARLPKIKAALALAEQAYALNLAQGSQDAACDPGGYKTTPNGGVAGVPADPNAFGHGYHSSGDNYAPSLQQTASGMFVQLLGGGNINSPMVQGYTRWIYDHYRYTDIGGVNGAGDLYNSWGASYFYYLWSSFKGIEFMIQQGIPPAGGNLSTTSYGTLNPAAGPVCTDRQVHRDPAALVRVPSFGAGGVAFYGAETKTHYFDYAYTLLSYQCVSGNFLCDAPASTGGFTNPGTVFGSWDGGVDSTAYALLVLQRATGVILPTATLTAASATATVGTTDTLTWTSTNANSCAASGGKAGDGWTGGSLATGGNLGVSESAPGVVTYTITCSAGSQTAQASVNVTWTKPNFLLCDVDSNGVIDSRDIQMIMKLIGQTVPPANPAADFDGNGVISINDARNCALRCTFKNCAVVK